MFASYVKEHFDKNDNLLILFFFLVEWKLFLSASVSPTLSESIFVSRQETLVCGTSR